MLRIRIEWDKAMRDKFADRWPCCDIPDTGYAEFDGEHDLCDISDNTRECSLDGGLHNFLYDLYLHEITE